MNPPARATDPVSAASQVYKYHRLSPELVERLISIYRTMFPHSTVPDEFYEHVVRKLDDKAVQDQDLSGLLSNGVEALNRQAGSAWTGLSEEARLQALQRVEQTPFFQTLRSDFVLYFYSNPAIWPLFGYEGPSNDQGGYLHRGFNDIDWINREEVYAVLVVGFGDGKLVGDIPSRHEIASFVYGLNRNPTIFKKPIVDFGSGKEGDEDFVIANDPQFDSLSAA